jgi:hypothetical protein
MEYLVFRMISPEEQFRILGKFPDLWLLAGGTKCDENLTTLGFCGT